MGKVFGIIAVIYILYYAGNIVYDLFIKKDNTVEAEQSDDFAIGEIPDNMQNIEIDDVENIRTPNSFNTMNNDAEEDDDGVASEESWKKKYEEENNINNLSEPIPEPLKLNEIKENPQNGWETLMLQASTNVSVVKDRDGNNIYKSTFNFT